MADFVETFLDWTEYAPSPRIFRQWAAIACVAGALERRVWIKAIQRPTYPNLYTLLVASPGIGKSVIDDAEFLWKKVKKFKIAPDSVTSASMIDSLKEAKRTVKANGSSHPMEYHSLLVPAEEFSFLVPSYEPEILARLIKIFNNPTTVRIRRKYLDEEIHIVRPQLNILAGAQPGFLASMLPEQAWKMGFTQRLLLIYSGKGVKVPLFRTLPERSSQEQELTRKIFALSELYGEFDWDPAARLSIEQWDMADGPPRPHHPRLSDYLNRRTQYLMKLMMISCASREETLCINSFDFERALFWLLNAEVVMPDVFREMAMKSDKHLLQELQSYTMGIWLRRGKKPLHAEVMLKWLEERMPREKVMQTFTLARHMSLIIKIGDDLYVPRDPSQPDLGEDIPKEDPPNG